MKKNLLLIIILNSFLILGFSSNHFAKKAAIVIDFDTEEVLFEVNADTRNYPASLTKIDFTSLNPDEGSIPREAIPTALSDGIPNCGS